MKEITLSRKELYDLVWSEPRLTITKRYYISDSELKKICERMNIPIPKAGYWEKLRAGKKVSIIEFPMMSDDKNSIKLSLKEEGDNDNIGKSPMEILLHEIENDSNLSLSVPLKLIQPDPLIIQAKEYLKGQKASSYGQSYSGLLICSGNYIDISISPDNVDRALRFMDTLIKLLNARGHKLRIEDGTTCVIINDEKIKVRLKEKSKRTPGKDQWSSSNYYPSGVLAFRIGNYSFEEREWSDGRLKIEEQLAKILANLELEARRIKDERIQHKKAQEEYQEKERIRREIEKKKETELLNFKKLLQGAHRLNQAEIIRNYINAVESSAQGENIKSEELEKWIEWARKKVEWYDPLIELDDELLKDVDKDTLIFKKSPFF
jgi:hypothetical protein